MIYKGLLSSVTHTLCSYLPLIRTNSPGQMYLPFLFWVESHNYNSENSVLDFPKTILWFIPLPFWIKTTLGLYNVQLKEKQWTAYPSHTVPSADGGVDGQAEGTLSPVHVHRVCGGKTKGCHVPASESEQHGEEDDSTHAGSERNSAELVTVSSHGQSMSVESLCTYEHTANNKNC